MNIMGGVQSALGQAGILLQDSMNTVVDSLFPKLARMLWRWGVSTNQSQN